MFRKRSTFGVSTTSSHRILGDQFGASSVTGLQGPVVTAPLGGVDPTLASAALGSAVALNEATPVGSPNLVEPKTGIGMDKHTG